MQARGLSSQPRCPRIFKETSTADIIVWLMGIYLLNCTSEYARFQSSVIPRLNLLLIMNSGSCDLVKGRNEIWSEVQVGQGSKLVGNVMEFN